MLAEHRAALRYLAGHEDAISEEDMQKARLEDRYWLDEHRAMIADARQGVGETDEI